MIKPILVAVAVLSYLASAYEPYDINDAPALFEKFVIQFKKTYEDEEDRQRHYETFVENLIWINEKNARYFAAGGQEAHSGITLFTDLTQSEFRDRYLGGYGPKKKYEAVKEPEYDYPY